jgi:hypothetical protein
MHEDTKSEQYSGAVERTGRAAMLRLSQGTRVFMAVAPIDMRNYVELSVMRSIGRIPCSSRSFGCWITLHNYSPSLRS